jgi:hypothetical protein
VGEVEHHGEPFFDDHVRDDLACRDIQRHIPMLIA